MLFSFVRVVSCYNIWMAGKSSKIFYWLLTRGEKIDYCYVWKSYICINIKLIFLNIYTDSYNVFIIRFIFTLELVISSTMFKVRLKLKHFNHYFELAFWPNLEIIVNNVLNKQTVSMIKPKRFNFINKRGSSYVVGWVVKAKDLNKFLFPTQEKH